jgi:predicted small secreted protein
MGIMDIYKILIVSNMKIIILYLLCAISITSCNTKTSVNKTVQSESSESTYKRVLEPTIEVWSHTGNDYLIGSFAEKIEDKYEQNKSGWDKDNVPYPKSFDVKVSVQNNMLAYEQEKAPSIDEYIMDVTLKLKVGQSPDATYPVNAKTYEEIEIVKDKHITNADFTDQKTSIEVWKKDVPFETFFKKYGNKGLFVNQLVFEVTLKDKSSKNVCNYEYIFPMAERGE